MLAVGGVVGAWLKAAGNVDQDVRTLPERIFWPSTPKIIFAVTFLI